jgi:hypothetical protein
VENRFEELTDAKNPPLPLAPIAPASPVSAKVCIRGATSVRRPVSLSAKSTPLQARWLDAIGHHEATNLET